jgi:YVTN family beta-propeller protein
VQVVNRALARRVVAWVRDGEDRATVGGVRGRHDRVEPRPVLGLVELGAPLLGLVATPDPNDVQVHHALRVTSEDGKVARIDPASNSIVATIPIQDSGSFVAFGGGAVWVTNYGTEGLADGMLTRIDPATNGVTASVTVGSGPGRLAYAGGSVWIGLYDAPTVVRVSATTNAVLNRVTVDHDVYSIAATAHAVWAVHPDPEPGVVTRIAY